MLNLVRTHQAAYGEGRGKIILHWLTPGLLNEVHQSNPVHPLEEYWDPAKLAQLSEPWSSSETV
jgi:hypothetical protein